MAPFRHGQFVFRRRLATSNVCNIPPMLERCEHDNGVVTYQSGLLRSLGVPHAFSTRIGGVSEPPYDTLNLGLLTKGVAPDNNTDVAENFRRLRRAIGLERHFRVQVSQVHGSEVWVAPREPRRLRDSPRADAIVGDVSGAMLTIRTADCVPLLLSSPDGRVVAAVHAGWRGIVAGVVSAAISRMQECHGIEAESVLAAVGPCISVEHFEVGVEVVEQFESAGLAGSVVHAPGRKPHIDLAHAIRTQLQEADVPSDSIDSSDRCTHRDADEFFSYRRDRGDTGRLAAVIAAIAKQA